MHKRLACGRALEALCDEPPLGPKRRRVREVPRVALQRPEVRARLRAVRDEAGKGLRISESLVKNSRLTRVRQLYRPARG